MAAWPRELERSSGGEGRGEMGMQAVRQGVGLSSARDRARLREREAAERERVERVLARGPREIERRRADRAEREAASTCACRVCGGTEVFEDEVAESRSGGGGLRLAWCRRCDYRWTERVADRFVPRFRRPAARASEVGGAERSVRRASGA